MEQLYKTYRIEMSQPDLLDFLLGYMNLNSDAALARTLELHAPIISRIRNGNLPIGANFLVRVLYATDLSMNELRALTSQPTRSPEKRFRAGWSAGAAT